MAAGTEFFLRRLQRAQQVPLAKRSPEVAAFVEQAGLLRCVARLLPLTAGGTAALPRDAAAARRALVAYCMVMRADYISPETPTGECNFPDHLSEYLMHLRPDGGMGNRIPGFPPGPLPLVLAMWHTAAAHPDGTASVAAIKDAIAQASHPILGAGLAMQLAHVASMAPEVMAAAAGGGGQGRAGQQQWQPLALTAQEMMFSLHARLAQTVGIVANPCQHHPGLELVGLSNYGVPAARRADMQAAADASVAAMRQMQPGSLKAAEYAALSSITGPGQQTADLFLRLHEMGRQQGSDWYVARAACGAAAACAPRGKAAVRAETLRAAKAAFEQSEGARRRLKRLLPEAWMQSLDQMVAVASAMLVLAQRTGRSSGQQQGSSPGAGSGNTAAGGSSSGRDAASGSSAGRGAGAMPDINATIEAYAGLGRSLMSMSQHCVCSGCGKTAVGLRRCSGCHTASYCR